MNLEEYKKIGKEKYEKLAGKVREILTNAIKDPNEINQKLCLLNIKNRAKDYKSLEEKIKTIKKNDQINEEHIEETIKDLAGCRIIFYYNDDVKNFISSDIIRKNFDVEEDNTKIHHSSDDYRAIHYVVKLKKNNKDKELDGLRCEIQIHTLLNHAFSETAHDISYKPIKTNEFGEKSKKDIDNRLKKVMTDYLVPAGYELQKIKKDHQNLLEGGHVLSEDNLKKILNASNTNEIYEVLEKYQNSIKYYNNLPHDFIFNMLKQSIDRAKNIPWQNIEPPFGNCPGYKFVDIFDLVLKILKNIQYIYIKKTFSLLTIFYLMLEEENSRKAIKDFVSDFSSYTIDIVEKNGFHIQQLLLTHIEKLDSEKSIIASDLICEICKSIFNFTICDWREEKENNDVVYQVMYPMPVNGCLKMLHQKSMNILFDLWPLCKDKQRWNIFQAIELACATSENEDLSRVFENSLFFVKFFVKHQHNESFSIRDEVYKYMAFLIKRSKKLPEKEKLESLFKLNQELLNAAEFLHKNMKNDKAFYLYHIVLDFKNPDKIDELFHTITSETFELYKEAILQCAEHNATLNNLEYFLEKLAERFPEQVLGLVLQENSLTRYLGQILKGLIKINPDYYHKLIDFYIEKGSYLSSIINSLELRYDERRFKKAYDKAFSSNDIRALYSVLNLVFKRRVFNPKSLFLDVIKKLTPLQDNAWSTLPACYGGSYKNSVKEMNEEEVEDILDNLECISSPNIDNYGYNILEIKK
jgi:ppGpp synthetase/RelA/SpoT-type nucleotidyltranferase